MAGRITIQLLESSKGHSMHSWTFEDVDVIRIGRATDNQIVVSHPCVSRAHACLSKRGVGWLLTARSEQGFFLGAQKLVEHWVEDSEVFRLGPSGPYLRVIQATDQPESEHLTTYGHGPVEAIKLVLDTERLARDVGEISEDEYFQNIQRSIAQLRGRQGSERPPESGSRGT